jgi:hypothetical protein
MDLKCYSEKGQHRQRRSFVCWSPRLGKSGHEAGKLWQDTDRTVIVAIKHYRMLSDPATECEAHLTLLHRQKKALQDGASDILQRVGT